MKILLSRASPPGVFWLVARDRSPGRRGVEANIAAVAAGSPAALAAAPFGAGARPADTDARAARRAPRSPPACASFGTGVRLVRPDASRARPLRAPPGRMRAPPAPAYALSCPTRPAWPDARRESQRPVRVGARRESPGGPPDSAAHRESPALRPPRRVPGIPGDPRPPRRVRGIPGAVKVARRILVTRGGTRAGIGVKPPADPAGRRPRANTASAPATPGNRRTSDDRVSGCNGGEGAGGPFETRPVARLEWPALFLT